MVSKLDLRKLYLGAPRATDEDMEIVKAVREYVEGEIMPCRRDLDGGWHHDKKLALDTFKKIHQGLVNIGVQRASWPVEFGGLDVRGIANDLIGQEIARGDTGVATYGYPKKTGWLERVQTPSYCMTWWERGGSAHAISPWVPPRPVLK